MSTEIEQAVNYGALIDRVFEILQKDPMLRGTISEWRRGDLPERTMATSFPCLYITTADRPQAARRMIGPSTSPSTFPSNAIASDLTITILANTGEAWTNQKQLYDVAARIDGVLALNNQLRRPTQQYDDPLAAAIEIDSIPRLTTNRGQMIDGISILLRVHSHIIRQPPPPPPPDEPENGNGDPGAQD